MGSCIPWTTSVGTDKRDRAVARERSARSAVSWRGTPLRSAERATTVSKYCRMSASSKFADARELQRRGVASLRQFATVLGATIRPKFRAYMRKSPLVPILWLTVAVAVGCGERPGAEDSSAAAAADPGRQVQHLIRTTASPFCPGKTLDSCPSPKAGEWRRDIREWAGSGVPADEIRDRLQQRVPGMDLSIRPARWSGVIPVVALLLSTLVMWLVARRVLGRRTATVQRQREHPERRDLLDQRLDEELARLAESS